MKTVVNNCLGLARRTLNLYFFNKSFSKRRKIFFNLLSILFKSEKIYAKSSIETKKFCCCFNQFFFL
jgi:hypothetical protein